MSFQRTEFIVVNGEQLALELSVGQGRMCLDLETGDLVPKEGLNDQDIGHGPLAVERGKRFIQIPNLDEVLPELRDRYEEWEFGDYEDNDDLLPDNPECAAVRESLRPVTNRIRQSQGYREFCEFLHAELASEALALRWIGSLRPPCKVGWYEKFFGVTRMYDPDNGGWDR